MTGATTTSSTINLTKTIIGSGMLAMPFAFRSDGYILGGLITLIAGTTSGFGLYLQARAAKYVPAGHATFFAICQQTYPSLSVLFDFAIAVQCFGVGLSYLVLIGDLLPTVVGYGSRVDWIVLSLLVSVPLCSFKNLDSLKYTSILALGAIAYMFLLVIGHFILDDVRPALRGETSLLPVSASGIFSTFPIIVLAFTGHQNMFTVINEIQNKSIRNLSRVIAIAITTSVLLFLAIGLAGYYSFGNKVVGNIIVMYDESLVTKIGQGSIALMVLLSFPLMFHPCRVSVNNIYFWLKSKPKTPEAAGLLGETDLIVPLSGTTFAVLTAVLLAASYALALSITSFALVLAIVGATGSTSISFILPGLFGYKLVGRDILPVTEVLEFVEDSVVKKLSLALAVWGVVVMVVCLYSTLVLGQ
ncbi:hypothetical protein BABINDRAFT_159769 [Babjeviella inositovora NRRL Y-12698]|uniref:Amino acid transporter transmembrane domain-containing protein n=1 Tax=Babjeviella inositovora NRRL Y-12698 TaxID=984486 RepID=A0A1E3QV10_9ASCO|nr:uncharacterized protein BABINDRAFT_159769 [Babjeviella inositovora NRRL Y-12698]ODQ81490.1 hypothetical protein BABINDRAFT_159769 [Babjeviella inositovora NRRL Y-12698]